MKGKGREWMMGAIIVALLVSGCREAASPVVGEGSLTASGTIRADEVRIASELGGRIVEVRARVGETVRAGDELVTLDATSLMARQAEAEAAVAAAQADLAVIQAGPCAEEIAAAQAVLDLAEAGRDGLLAAWENALEAVENPQELDAQISEARTKLELAAQSAELARAQLAREQLLRDQRPEGSVERQIADLHVKAAQEALTAAQADERTAQKLLDWLWLIRDEPLGLVAQAHAAEGRWRAAVAGVAVEQARLDDLLAGPAEEEIAVAEATVYLARAQADVLRAQQARFALSSPVDGVLLDQALRAGEVAAPGATILTVADLSTLTLVVYVPENRVGQVRLGQEVQVTADSFPDQTFAGQVTRINDEAEFTPRNVATQEERLNTFYAVEVRLPNAEGLLKPGMPADATFDRD